MSRQVVAGVVAVLLAVGAWLLWSHRTTERAVTGAPSSGQVSTSSSLPLTETPAGEVRLENLASVSLREVSDLLTSRKPAEIARLAHQLEQLRSGSKTQSAITQFFKAWVQLDPDAALKTAITFTDRSSKEIALRAIFESATPEAAARITVAVRDAPADAIAPMMRSELLASGIAKWSEFDPVGAAAFFDQYPDVTIADRMNTPGGASLLVVRLATNWARVDPQAAMAWSDRQPDHTARQGAIAGWWEKDPAGAEAYALSHRAAFEESKLAGIVASRMAGSDPQRAAEYIAQLPAEERSSPSSGS